MPDAPSRTGAEVPSIASAPPQTTVAAHTTATDPSRSSSPSRTAYLPQLDGLRAIAIIMVFLHHAYAIPLLWSGVDLFFILSGYLITNILLRDSGRMSFGQMLRHFYLRRAQRILPAYAIALALIVLVCNEDWHRLWPFYTFFLQNVPYAFRWIGFSPLIPLWSLAVEQHFYLFWPFLVFFLPRRWLAPSMIAILLGVPLLRAVCTPLFSFPEPIYVLTPFRIDAMAAGALAALVLPLLEAKKVKRGAYLGILAGLLLYALLGIHPWFRRDANTVAFNAIAYSLNILILGGVFLLTLLAQPRSLLTRLLASSPMRGLGRISYAFYLFHLFVIVRLGPYFAPRAMPAICFLITVVLATLSWVCIEKPVLSLGGGHRGAAGKPARLPR